MYVHIGQNTVVLSSDIVGIFDLDNTSYSHISREFLASAESSGQVIAKLEDLPKSFLLCREPDGDKVYLSQLSSATLAKRCVARIKNEEL